MFTKETRAILEGVQTILKAWQDQNNHKGFGQCLSCRYHQANDKIKFKCGLTGEFLLVQEELKLCREHDFYHLCDQNK